VDPYADKAAANRRRFALFLVILIAAALITAKVLGSWPFSAPAPMEKPAVVAPAAPAAAPKK
jgi:hypothetical protein